MLLFLRNVKNKWSIRFLAINCINEHLICKPLGLHYSVKRWICCWTACC